MKSAGGILVQRALKAGSRFLHRSREKRYSAMLKLSEELDRLKTTMSTDNGYRDACIMAWEESGGYWR
jgi:hypothetical protein